MGLDEDVDVVVDVGVGVSTASEGGIEVLVMVCCDGVDGVDLLGGPG